MSRSLASTLLDSYIAITLACSPRALSSRKDSPLEDALVDVIRVVVVVDARRASARASARARIANRFLARALERSRARRRARSSVERCRRRRANASTSRVDIVQTM